MLPSHIFSPVVRIIGMLMIFLGILVVGRVQHFSMDWSLQGIWFMAGLIIGLAGFIILIYTPWRPDREWFGRFGKQ